MVEAGLYQTCAGGTGVAAACWGTNDAGQLGAQTTQLCVANDPLHPNDRPCSKAPLVPDGVPLARASPGSTHTCGVDGMGGAFCWGGQILNFGQVGNGTLDGASAPVPVSAGGPYAAVYTSHGPHIRTFSCGLGSDGGALCWGANRWGQLGSGPSPDCGNTNVPCRPDPTPAAGGYSFVSL